MIAFIFSHFREIGLCLLVGTFAFSLWKGELAERVGGSLNLAAGIFAMVVPPLLAIEVRPSALLVVDAILAAGFLFLAVRYASLWLGAAMLLQAVQFSLHAYYMVSDLPHDVNYARINNADTLLISLAIILGTIVSSRRRQREDKAEAASRQATQA